MSTKAPPIPPESQKEKENTEPPSDKLREETQRPNSDAEARADNLKQNTTNQGHQQDR